MSSGIRTPDPWEREPLSIQRIHISGRLKSLDDIRRLILRLLPDQSADAAAQEKLANAILFGVAGVFDYPQKLDQEICSDDLDRIGDICMQVVAKLRHEAVWKKRRATQGA